MSISKKLIKAVVIAVGLITIISMSGALFINP